MQHRPSRRLRVEEVHALDLANLRRDGLLRRPDAALVSTWQPSPFSPGRSEVALRLVSPREHPTALAVLDRAGPVDVWGSAEAYVVQLDWTRPHFGGWRPWFRCPARGCGRRVRVLFRPLGARYFACRGCHRLTYRSRQLHRDRWYEGFERPERAVKRLARAMDPRCSPRRLVRALRRAEALMPQMERLVARVVR